MFRARLASLLAAAAVTALACNAVLDNEPGILDEGAVDGGGRSDTGARPVGSRRDAGATPDPEGCGAGSKDCGGLCVSTRDPHFGCASTSCMPCGGAHATATCASGACAIGACDVGFGDCNADPRDGCEADFASVTSCGACGVTCPAVPNATSSCDAGACSLACAPGFADCNGDPKDGCEIDTREDKRHCGACGTRCIFGGKCREGVCRWEWD